MSHPSIPVDTDLGVVKGTFVRIHLRSWEDGDSIPIEHLDALCKRLAREKSIWPHCEQGLGRTGTFITAWLLHRFQHTLSREKLCIDINNYILSIRKARHAGMVQTPSQYFLLYEYGHHLIDQIRRRIAEEQRLKFESGN